ncbi:MAG: c-type heme family protein [Casimicrobiaceae bacterium]
MKLIWKFNLALGAVAAVAFILAAIVSYTVLHANARDEVLQNARVMMESASASADYTNAQVRPLLETQLKYKFIPQSVPAFAAAEQFNELRKNYPDYTFKAATLNPTNPRNHATDWEVDIVNQFRQSPTKTEVIGERASPTGRSLYLARPIQIKDAACLTCHSTPDAAPRTMIETYGSANGFGWKLNDIVGAQIVSVPTSVPVHRANFTFRVFLLSLLGVFAFTIGMLNLMLYWFVIRRVKRLSKLADEVSLGNLEAGEFQTQSKDEIGVLTEALGRMKTSMVQAIKMLDAHG